MLFWLLTKSKSQNVKNIVDKLVLDGREEQNSYRKVYRPWGWFDSVTRVTDLRLSVSRSNQVQVLVYKSIIIERNTGLWLRALQTLFVGRKKLTLSENQSTYIPLGEKHRLSNPGNTPVEIVEVQSGGLSRRR